MFTRSLRRASRLLSPLVAIAALTGCAPQPTIWEENYAGQSAVAPVSSAAGGHPVPLPVLVRNVPWDRVQTTLRELQDQAATSDIHPEDWPADQKSAAKAQLLRGLQVSSDPAAIDVLGRSEFRTTADVRPDTAHGQADLVLFAQKIGADTVIWSSAYIRHSKKVVEVPVTSYTTRHDWWWGGYDRRYGRYYGGSPWGYESSTTWVPMKLPADEIGYTAFFLRSTATPTPAAPAASR